MDKGERDRLITRLKIESSEMMDEFAILVDKTKESLEKQRLSPKDLVVLIKHTERSNLEKLFTKYRKINKLFYQLSDYWSFFDYELLCLIIKRHCPELKPELSGYEADFKCYCQRRICELPIDVFKTKREHKNNLYIKTDKNFDKLTINEVKVLECKISRLLNTDLYFLSYHEGCVKLEFQSSRNLDYNIIFQLLRKKHELREIGVTEINFHKFHLSTIDPGMYILRSAK